jgi:hypothetical protein
MTIAAQTRRSFAWCFVRAAQSAANSRNAWSFRPVSRGPMQPDRATTLLSATTISPSSAMGCRAGPIHSIRSDSRQAWIPLEHGTTSPVTERHSPTVQRPVPP